MANTIQFIENIGGEERVTERVISSTGFAVKIDGQLYSPAVTTNVEIENDGDQSTTSDQCGNTERERETNNGWVVRIQGICTKNDDRQGNLSLQLLRDVVATSDTVKVRSDVINRRVAVSNTLITQSSDLISIQTEDTNGEEQAFEFQLQLGESKSDN